MYKNPAEWFACNYTMPKRMYGDYYPIDFEPRGLSLQYERLVRNDLSGKELPMYHELKRTFCGYLGEILFSAGVNHYLNIFYPSAGFVSRLANWSEDTQNKYDVVIFDTNNPQSKVGIQIKLNKNTRSHLNSAEPFLGLRVGNMNLGIEDLISSDPPYLRKPRDFIRERFDPQDEYLGKFMDSLFSQVGSILRDRITQPHRVILALSGTNRI